MKSLKVEYTKESDTIQIEEKVSAEEWPDVCEKFNDDVHRVRNVNDQDDFTALYECFDDDDNSIFYLVQEDSNLEILKRKHFRDKLGLE